MDLMQYFKGFIRNYSSLMIFPEESLRKFTDRENGYFAKLGEMMGYHACQEVTLKIKGKNKRADLIWSNYNNQKKSFSDILQLENENTETIPKVLETKMYDIPNLIVIGWKKSEDHSHLIESAKYKMKESEFVENILLIVQENKVKHLLITGIHIDKKKKKPDKCLGIVTENEAGYLYGLLKDDIEIGKWEKLIIE